MISRLHRFARRTGIPRLLFRAQVRIPFGPARRRIDHAGTVIPSDSFQLHNTYKVAPDPAADLGRYVVSADVNDIYSGLGALLLALGPCWLYARKTERTLIIDWRGNPYTRDEPELNLFSRLFVPPDPAAIGVPCIADDSINDLALPQPLLGPARRYTHEDGHSHMLPNGGLGTNDMRNLIASGIDVPFPTVMPSLQTAHAIGKKISLLADLGVQFQAYKDLRLLFRNLTLRPEWASQVEHYQRTEMANGPVIGVHIRHGNGEGNFRQDFKSREILGFEDFLDLTVRRIKRYAAKRFKGGYSVFLCTDSPDVIDQMRDRFPALHTRSFWRPGSGQGVDFDHAYKQPGGGLDSAVNALVDMELLAKCDATFMARPTAFACHGRHILEKPGAVWISAEKSAWMPA